MPAPAEGGREREKHRIREDFEAATTQRLQLQVVTNASVLTCLSSLDTKPLRYSASHGPTAITDQVDRARPTTNADGYRLGYAIVPTNVHYATRVLPLPRRRGGCRGVDPGTCAEEFFFSILLTSRGMYLLYYKNQSAVAIT